MKLNSINRKQLLAVVAGVVLIAAVMALFFWERRSSAAQFLTVNVNTGSIHCEITATGALQAVTTVQVGSEVSGTVASLNADFNSRVSKGQVLVQLDPAVYEAEISQAQATLEQARANLANARARVIAAEAELANEQAGVSGADANLAALRSERSDASDYLRREQDLSASGVIAARDLEAAQNNFRSADARYNQGAAEVDQARATEQLANRSGLAEAHAQVNEAQAQIEQNEAAIRLAQTNLNYTTIRSPIDGVVISRNVDVGQTIAASLQTPVLFTIAADLTRMQVLANIDQADIGLINTSSQARFTVDAYPGDTFTGEIQQIRLSPQEVDNVVTYNVVINVANPDLKLKPGMTANLVITYAGRDDVLRIRNAALSYIPAGVTQGQIHALLNGTPENVPSQAATEQSAGKAASANAIPPTTAATVQNQWHLVWVLGPDHKPQSRKITLGLTDGINTEVTAGNLVANESVIIKQAGTR